MKLFLFAAISMLALAPAHAGSTVMTASWYDAHRGVTADGSRFGADAPIAAHRTLPFGTVLIVTNPKNGRRIKVVVHDRGPFVRGRDLDLSRPAARALGFLEAGTARLDVSIKS